MGKLKENGGFKVAVAICLIVSLLGTLVSGMLGVMLLNEDVFNPGGKERVRNKLIESISWEYKNDAIGYYQDLLNNQDSSNIEDYLSEENCNYAFTITPDDDNYPTISNYTIKDYQYKSTEKHTIYGGSAHTRKFSFKLGKQRIIGRLAYSMYGEGEEVYPINHNEIVETTEGMDATTEVEVEVYGNPGTTEWDVYEDEWEEESDLTFEPIEKAYVGKDGSFLAKTEPPSRRYLEETLGVTDDDKIDYYNMGVSCYYDDNMDLFLVEYNGWYMVLDELSDFRQEIESCKNENSTMVYTYEAYYNDISDTVIVTVQGTQLVDITLDSYVKAELTAYDNYYSSFYLKYVDLAVDATIPVFLVSLLVSIVCIVFLTMSCGRRKGQEEITYNFFDQIPFDVLIALELLAFVLAYQFTYYTGWQYGATSTILITYCALALLAVIELVVLYMTLVTRMKARSWGFLKETFLARVILWVLRVCKKIFKKCGKGIGFLWKHISIYWKYLGIFLGGNLFIGLFSIATSSLGGTMSLLLLETIVFGVILAIALINMKHLKDGAKTIAKGDLNHKIDTSKMLLGFKEHGEDLNHIRDGISVAVKNQMKSERMKTELITNVSHDIKTPLTSIISYVDLLKKEPLGSEKAGEYIEVLDRQSARLKKLIQDLLDASKASTGNIDIKLEDVDVRVTLEQALGEFADRLEQKNLRVVNNYNAKEEMVTADGKLLWRVFDNIITNISKYAMEGSRVYIDVSEKDSVRKVAGANNPIDNSIDGEIYENRDAERVLEIAFKNISAEPLNISGDELMERFVRGDSSRNTEGSGLGLSIAKSLMELMGGSMNIIVDGDLFKVVLTLRLDE